MALFESEQTYKKRAQQTEGLPVSALSGNADSNSVALVLQF